MKIKTDKICTHLGPGGELATIFNGRKTYGFATNNTYYQIQTEVIEVVSRNIRPTIPIINAGFWANWNKDRGYSFEYWSHNPSL